MKLKVFDRSMVLVEGPYVDDSRTLMLISRPYAVAAAMHYVSAVKSCAVAVRDLATDTVDLSPRQHTMARLLVELPTDRSTARMLDLSVRTVRSDIAAFVKAIDVPNAVRCRRPVCRPGQHQPLLSRGGAECTRPAARGSS